MSKLYPVSAAFAAKARIDKATYEQAVRRIGARSRGVLAARRQAPGLDHAVQQGQGRLVRRGRPAHPLVRTTASSTSRRIASTAISPRHGDKTAIIWEGDDPASSRRISYRELHAEVCRCANLLKNLGIGKGDRVCIYLPMIPGSRDRDARLRAHRRGAFGRVRRLLAGFARGPHRRFRRASLVITADEGVRGGKKVPLKANVDEALTRPGTNSVETVIVVKHTGGAIAMQPPRDRWWHTLMEGQPTECAPEPMNAEDPLFILYTSGSTGKPKGVLHTTGGYLVYASYTHKCVFDLRDDDIYWCTADVGWVTGHSYILYGPLATARRR